MEALSCCLSPRSDLAHGQREPRAGQPMNQRALLKDCCCCQSARVIKPPHTHTQAHTLASFPRPPFTSLSVVIAGLLSSALVAKLAPLLFFGFRSDTLEVIAWPFNFICISALKCFIWHAWRQKRTPPVDPTAPQVRSGENLLV